jgi:hypothetical protein
MESELLYTKERLAVERKVRQPLKSLAGESAGAALAHMRQRVIRAEREARAARRLAIALFCASLAGMAGILLILMPWCVAPPPALGARGRRGPGAVPAWAGSVHGPLLLHGEPPPPSQVPQPAPPSPSGPAPVTQPASPIRNVIPGPNVPAHVAEAGTNAAPQTQPRLLEPAGRPNSSLPPGSNTGGHAGKPAPESVHPTGRDAATSTHPHGPGHVPPAKPAASAPRVRVDIRRPAPHHVWPSPHEQRSAFLGHSRGFRQTVRFSRYRTPRAVSRRRWPSHDRGHSRYWRVLRVSTRGPATYCLVDPHGNRWVARPVRSRSYQRGDERK